MKNFVKTLKLSVIATSLVIVSSQSSFSQRVASKFYGLPPSEIACLKLVLGNTYVEKLDHKKGKLAWNKAGANIWGDQNAQFLCGGTPISDYPTQCFKAAIDVDIDWRQGAQMCRYDFNSCVYQAMTQNGMRASTGGTVALGKANFRKEVYQCAYGKPLPRHLEQEKTGLEKAQADRLYLTECSKTAKENKTKWSLIKNGLPQKGLSQDETTDLCGDIVFTDEPVKCVDSAAPIILQAIQNRGRQDLLNASGEIDNLKRAALNLCNKSVNAAVTLECFQTGIADSGQYPIDDVISVCGTENATYTANRGAIHGHHETFGVIWGLRNSCVRNNALTKKGNIELRAAWKTCRGQPLF